MTDALAEAIVRQATRRFGEGQAATWAPYVAVLGPCGSGKSDYLGLLRSCLSRSALQEPDRFVHVDLRRIPLGSEAEMFAHFVYELRATGQSSGTMVKAPSSDGADQLEEFIHSVLADDKGRLVVFVDSLDAVPEILTRAVLRCFRSYQQRRDQSTDFRRLSLVCAGSVSIFDLKKDPDSAIVLDEVVILPSLDAALRLAWVRTQLARLGALDPPQPLVERLAAETGGEPAFLGPLLDGVLADSTAIDVLQSTVERRLDDCDWLFKKIPILEDILLAAWADPQLRHIVDQLVNHEQVRPSQLHTDVDPYQLLGAVALDTRRRSPTYVFRNELVERFLSHVGTITNGSADSEATHRGPIADKIIALQRLSYRMKTVSTIPDCVATIGEAWNTLVRRERPRIDLAVLGGDTYWSVDGAQGTVEPTDLQDEALRTASGEARRRDRLVIVVDDREVVAALPVSRRPDILILCRFSKPARATYFGEPALVVWQTFVGNAHRLIQNLALAEVGRWAVEEARKSRKAHSGAPPAPDLFAKRLRAYEERTRVDVRGRIRALKIVLVYLVVLLVAGSLCMLILPGPLARLTSAWEWLEPVLQIFSIASLVVIGALTVMGFKPRWQKIRDRAEKRIIERLVKRRLRLAHLLDPT